MESGDSREFGRTFDMAKLTIEVVSDVVLQPNDAKMLKLHDVFSKMNDVAAPLKRFEFVKQLDDSYDYVITTVDGRIWKSNMVLTTNQFSASFEVVDHWLESEFIPHRDIRSHVVQMARDVAGLSNIEVNLDL